MSIKDLRNTIIVDNNGNLRAGLKRADTKKLTVYWLDGTREVLEGTSAGDALQRAGYGHGALPVLDFIANGEDDRYVWKDGRWVKKVDS